MIVTNGLLSNRRLYCVRFGKGPS